MHPSLVRSEVVLVTTLLMQFRQTIWAGVLPRKGCATTCVPTTVWVATGWATTASTSTGGEGVRFSESAGGVWYVVVPMRGSVTTEGTEGA